MNLVWIPGWHYSAQIFQLLWTELGLSSPTLLSYADSQQPLADWLEEQRANLPDPCRVIGWSLGGMLACELARHSARVQQVMVLCANTRFAGDLGLPLPVADGFKTRYQRQPEVMRTKFAALVDRQAAVVDNLLVSDCSHTLQWLYELDVGESLPVPVNVLLAQQDQLVPVQGATQAWRQLADSVTALPGEHSLPLTAASQVAHWIRTHG